MGDGEVLELLRSARAASGYKGVKCVVEKGRLGKVYEASFHGTNLGVFETAREAAIAYAREVARTVVAARSNTCA
jgi:hypothetical protein